MRRIEYVIKDDAQRGYWDWNQGIFIINFPSKLASYDYMFEDGEFEKQYALAEAAHISNGGNPGDLFIRDFATQQEVISFETEYPDQVLANSDAKEFYIYMETRSRGNIFLTTNFEGIQTYMMPVKGKMPIGDYKIFNREKLKEAYTDAIRDFKSTYKQSGMIKLHIYTLHQTNRHHGYNLLFYY